VGLHDRLPQGGHATCFDLTAVTLRAKLTGFGLVFCVVTATLVGTLLWGSLQATRIRTARELARKRVDTCLVLGASLHLALHHGGEPERAAARRALEQVEAVYGRDELGADLDLLRRVVDGGASPRDPAAGGEVEGSGALRRLVEHAQRQDALTSAATADATRLAQVVAVTFAVVAVLVSIAAAGAVLPRLRRGLGALQAGAARLGAGDLSRPIDLDGQDELAQVARSLDGLAARLQETTFSADHLEALVGERTAELERSRRELAARVAQLEAARSHLGAAERLASVGRLARGVAHEVNNPLAVVRANLDYVAEELQGMGGAPADLRDALSEAGCAARRVSQIVQDLMAFARDGGNEAGAADLAIVLAHVERLVGHELRRRARFDLGVPAGPLLVQGAASRLGHVFTHLLLDAAGAVPDGARERHRITVRVHEDAGAVRVEVHDDGAPIPPALLPHLFDPYFTPTAGFATGATGRTTGLGLAVCFGLVEAAGGTIAAESTPGAGTTFRVTLRRATSETRLSLAPIAAAVRPARPRVLVVDDDPLVCASLYRVLSSRFDVVPHTSARTALGLLVAGERFDAILCDLAMPDMSGMDLFAALEGTHPAAAAGMIFLTGGVFTPESEAFLARVPNVKVEKPFVPADLVKLVQQRCAERAAGLQAIIPGVAAARLPS
jgi:signal transduction histidine kinase